MAETKPRNERNLQLGRIHQAKAALAMDDDVYRAKVREVSGERTSTAAELDFAERAKLLDCFRRLGWQPRGFTPAKKAAEHKQRLVNKIHAQLASAQRPWAYADGMARRMYKVQKVDWLDAEQLRGLVAALERDAQRRAAKAAVAAERPPEA